MDSVLVGNITIALVSFIAGTLVGFFGRGLFNGKDDKIESNQMVLIVVTAVWAVSVLIDIVSPTYDTSPLIHGLMGAIVGFFYKPFQKGGQDEPKK